MSAWPAFLRRDSAPDWRHGLQLAAAVTLSYLASAALHLPESFWAVMSALIVVRPTAGSTLGAGWDRVRGTFAGTLIGLAGVWLNHHGLGSSVSTLAMVAAVAFASAVFPVMRSAPISALIVLTSAGIAGHSALGVALMRVAEISIGVAVGLAVSLAGLAAQARGRFDAACAGLLRQLAAQARRELGTEPSTPQQREAAAGQRRLALRELTLLATAADREARLLQRGKADGARDAYLRRARLVARIAHDTGSFGRLAEAVGTAEDGSDWAALGGSVAEALNGAAARLEGGSGQLDALRQFLKSEGNALQRWAAPPARLLLQDLSRLTARQAGS